MRVRKLTQQKLINESLSAVFGGKKVSNIQISVVIPAYNEEDNIEPLYDKLKSTLNQFKKTHEIIFIDDGSKDGTFEALSNLRKKDNSVKIIRFRRNYGQTAAWDVGFKHASG